MIALLAASLVCFIAILALRPAPSGTGPGSLSFSGLNGISVIAIFIVFVAVSALLGKPFALPVIASLLLLELGQVLACRMLGHRPARFRLVPLLSRERISDQPLKTDGDRFLVAIMGPALNLASMSLALGLSSATATAMPELSRDLWLFATTTGAVNFIALMPFRPFFGAELARAAVASYWPALAPAMTVFMSTAMATASLRTGSVVLMAGAVVGARSLFVRSPAGPVPMKPDHGLIALAAYVFTMAAHFAAGWMLFSAYFQ